MPLHTVDKCIELLLMRNSDTAVILAVQFLDEMHTFVFQEKYFLVNIVEYLQPCFYNVNVF